MEAAAPVLLTDLYQLTMAHAYFELGMRETAVFELFVRRLPPTRRFLLAGGLEQMVQYLENLRFSAAELEFLKSLGTFPPAFIDHLADLRFTGSLHAMPEGTPFFANEPILRITAPILEAQLVESRLLNLAHFQTLIASKAIRCVLAAGGKHLVDFGMRRAHGAEAAILAARAAFLAGFDGTATVEAGRQFGIPLSGTMAHSFIEAHDREFDAFRNFLTVRGPRTTLLIDTYDAVRATQCVIQLAREFRTNPDSALAVRIDSGDLAAQARMIRGILDREGCGQVQIILSGSLDEHEIQELLASGTPVDAFGVGTRLAVSQDAPSLDLVYKLQEYAGRARLKRSLEKQTWPGIKQVVRSYDTEGRACRDLIALESEEITGKPLLHEVMRDGRRSSSLPSLEDIREYCRSQVEELPAVLRTLNGTGPAYDVQISERLQTLSASTDGGACGTP
jgi:nicotinate phosphoribosyltransferase